MSHQPFESWILLDETITPEKQQYLDKHLGECEQCNRLLKALVEVNKTFSTSPSPPPAPGFTQRWHARLSMVRQQRLQRSMWFLTLGMFTIAGLIFMMLILVNMNTINWTYEISQLIGSVSLVAGRTRQILNVINSLTNAFPILIPVIIIFGTGIVLATSALVVTWFSSVINLYKPIHKGVNTR